MTKQKIALVFAAALVLLLGGGFLFLTLADVSVPQTTVTKTIPNERFSQTP